MVTSNGVSEEGKESENTINGSGLIADGQHSVETMLGFGFKDVTVEFSEDGIDWTILKEVQFAQATARADYAANTMVDLEGVLELLMANLVEVRLAKPEGGRAYVHLQNHVLADVTQ